MVTHETDVVVLVSRTRQELRRQGTPDFPCAGYYADGTEPESIEIPWHAHPEFEIIQVLEGEKRVQVPGRSFMLKAGQSVFFNSGVLHYACTERGCRFRSLVFSPALLYGSEASAICQKYILPLAQLRALDCCVLENSGWQAEAQAAFGRAYAALEAEAPFGYECAVRGGLTECCVAVYGRNRTLQAAQPDALRDRERLQTMMEFVQKHYGDALDVADIAAAASISPREAQRCFQRLIRLPPIRYLRKYRSAQAAGLLLTEPERKIASVAAACGFDSPSYFSAAFLQDFGCSPQEYRSRHAG